MASIATIVQAIRTAVYGKDVRENIANGIEAINKEVENTTSRQTQLESSMTTAKEEVIQATADAIEATNYANNVGTSASSAATAATNAAESANNASLVANNFVNASKVCEPYDNIKTYNKFNKVTNYGSTYQCLIDGTVGITPGTDNTKWLLIAAKGSDGVGGDMFKNIYDTDGDGVVDKAETITDGSITYSASDLKNNFDTVTSDLADLSTYSTYKLNKDANDIYTEIHHKRPNGTLISKSILSGGSSPQYTTRTVTEYSTDGTTTESTKVYALSYDVNENLISEVLA